MDAFRRSLVISERVPRFFSNLSDSFDLQYLAVGVVEMVNVVERVNLAPSS